MFKSEAFFFFSLYCSGILLGHLQGISYIDKYILTPKLKNVRERCDKTNNLGSHINYLPFIVKKLDFYQD